MILACLYTRGELLTVRGSPGVRWAADYDLLERIATCGLLRYRGSRAGLHQRARHHRDAYISPRADRGGESTVSQAIPVRVSQSRTVFSATTRRKSREQNNLIYPATSNLGAERPIDDVYVPSTAPSIYLIDPTSLAKPHAIEHLRADISSYKPDVVIVVESWFKQHHTDTSMAVPDYNLYRRDRESRRGSGVAVYCRSCLQSSSVILLTDFILVIVTVIVNGFLF